MTKSHREEKLSIIIRVFLKSGNGLELEATADCGKILPCSIIMEHSRQYSIVCLASTY